MVLVKSGEKDAEKRFLGYEFSNRRGNEGIHPIQKGKNIEDCTQLFDPEIFDNPEKASTYIYKAFHRDFDFPVDVAMQKNVTRHKLIDMLTFDRVDFEKNISLSIKKKVKIESKWKLVRLGDILEEQPKSKIKVGTAKDVANGNYPFYTSGEAILTYNDFLVDGKNIYLSTGGNAIIQFFNGKTAYSTDTYVVKSKNENNFLTEFIFHCIQNLTPVINEFYFKGLGLKHLQKNDFRNLQIPLPPINIQEKIVAEVEVLEEKNRNAKEKTEIWKNEIDELFNEALSKTEKALRLSDDEIFEVFIGKRVLKNEFVPTGKIPVYSANVIEPFGNIDKLLINDFSKSSVIWGIDGDWMVNYLPKDYSFYPTDHCGVLRVKNNAVNEKYLAFVLEKEGKSLNFSRTKRASIDRIQGIKIPVPPLSEQQKIVSEIDKIEEKINILEKEMVEILKQKEAILKKYL